MMGTPLPVQWPPFSLLRERNSRADVRPKLLPAHHKAGVQFLVGPRRREVASWHQLDRRVLRLIQIMPTIKKRAAK
jgi:hypothetical protein